MIIVTRHSPLVELIRERAQHWGWDARAVEQARVMSHVDTPEVLCGEHVVGVLPLHLAATAASITEVPLALTLADRGRQLPLERLREIAGDPVAYQVVRLPESPAGWPPVHGGDPAEPRMVERFGSRGLPDGRNID